MSVNFHQGVGVGFLIQRADDRVYGYRALYLLGHRDLPRQPFLIREIEVKQGFDGLMSCITRCIGLPEHLSNQGDAHSRSLQSHKRHNREEAVYRALRHGDERFKAIALPPQKHPVPGNHVDQGAGHRRQFGPLHEQVTVKLDLYYRVHAFSFDRKALTASFTVSTVGLFVFVYAYPMRTRSGLRSSVG